MSKMPEKPAVLLYEQAGRDDPAKSAAQGTAPPPELVSRAKKTGAWRKKIARGEAGFFMNRSFLPAGFRVPPHSHDHDELMVVLAGGCSFDEGLADLAANDSIVIHANYRYGFTCGSEGMEFLTIRMGEARMAVDE